jgi:hypothetical protein
MTPVVIEQQGRKSPGHADNRVWVARRIVNGEHVEGRGADREAALVDLVERLAERVEGRA